MMLFKNIAGGDALVSKEGVFLKENGHYRATADIDMDTNKLGNLAEPQEDGDAVNKKYVDDVAKSLTAEEALIEENGGYNVLDGYSNMNFNEIKNLKSPENCNDTVTKEHLESYVDENQAFSKTDAVDDPKLNDELRCDGVDDISAYEAKGVLTAPHRIGLYQEDFKDENDAVNVKYVETQVSNLNRSLTRLIDFFNVISKTRKEV